VAFQLHSYRHDPKASSYGLEAAEMLGIEPERVFKTLVVRLDGRQLGVAMVPVHRQLDLKAAARALGAKRAEMAPAAEVARATGYVLGGVSPLGQKRRLSTVLDRSAEGLGTLFCSAGRRGLEIELAPQVLVRLLCAAFAGIAR
jgi:Cys-tRNA(Pro)/Cys-tRNA(Cys) deacylase